jgi:hypothetical protein
MTSSSSKTYGRLRDFYSRKQQQAQNVSETLELPQSVCHWAHHYRFGRRILHLAKSNLWRYSSSASVFENTHDTEGPAEVKPAA